MYIYIYMYIIENTCICSLFGSGINHFFYFFRAGGGGRRRRPVAAGRSRRDPEFHQNLRKLLYQIAYCFNSGSPSAAAAAAPAGSGVSGKVRNYRKVYISNIVHFWVQGK